VSVTRPTRATVAGQTYLDLQNLARRTNRPTDELHQLYALEGFLARLVISPYADRFVLKGGVLLAAYDVRRPTRDVDLQGRHISNEVEQVLGIICEIADVDLDDGLSIDTNTASADVIRDEDLYSGVRVTLTGNLATARLTFHVDVNVGDPVWPAPQRITLPRLLDGRIELAGYPLAMVFSEKLVTAVWRGTANTRWRDFADIYALSGHHDMDGAELRAAIVKVADFRQVPCAPLSDVLDGFATLAQQRWSAWQRRQRLDIRLPNRFGDVLDAVIAFGDPVLTDAVRGAAWSAAVRQWLPLT
jgi:hypothetical protein